MKVLMVLNYYYPYISGVSEYARIIAEEMVAQGHEVRVVASNHAKLPQHEVIGGVQVTRTSVLCKISKGTISPSFITRARKMAKQADAVLLHLPMLESSVIAAGIDPSKLFVAYQCDVNLPRGLLNRFIVKVMDASNNRCLKRAHKIFVTSVDYAKHSRIAARYDHKLVEAGAPIKPLTRQQVDRPQGIKTIGFCGRIVEEKGIDVLLEAFHLLQQQRDDIRLLVGGDYQNVAGGSIYPQLQASIQEKHIENVTFLGRIAEEDMAEFYSSLDVLTLPSINSLEAFGMVQVEAMMCGVPVVASDLPGVRTIVQTTAMGCVCKRRDPQDLASCIADVLDHPDDYRKPRDFILSCYSTPKTTQTYLDIMNMQGQ